VHVEPRDPADGAQPIRTDDERREAVLLGAGLGRREGPSRSERGGSARWALVIRVPAALSSRGRGRSRGDDGMTLKPITDRAEVAIDFPDKAYMGSFGAGLVVRGDRRRRGG
jgi:hypothetical protein